MSRSSSSHFDALHEDPPRLPSIYRIFDGGPNPDRASLTLPPLEDGCKSRRGSFGPHRALSWPNPERPLARPSSPFSLKMREPSPDFLLRAYRIDKQLSSIPSPLSPPSTASSHSSSSSYSSWRDGYPPILSRRYSHDACGINAYHPTFTHQDAQPQNIQNPSLLAKHQCSYCGKRFNRPSGLKIHLTTHTGDKPFVCPEEGCHRGFSVRSNMRRHVRIVHQLSRGGGDSAKSESGESARED